MCKKFTLLLESIPVFYCFAFYCILFSQLIQLIKLFLILHEDNQNKYKILFLNDDFI